MPYESENNPTDRPCPKCQGELVYDVWESSDGGHEDLQFHCKTCGHSFWIDGIDS